MQKKFSYWMMAAILTICGASVCTSCTQKEQAAKDTIVNVKTMKVTSSSHVMGKNYMGTIEEEDGANVSFGVIGNVVRVMVLDEFDIHPAKESDVKIVDWDRTYFLTKYYML